MSKKDKTLSNAELSAFCQQIAMVLKAGLPTYYGVSLLCDEAPDEDTKELYSKIYKPMETGAPLYDALVAVGGFPEYMVDMIQLGEETGRLEEVLLALSAYYTREDHIRKSIKSAITYPFVLTVLMLIVIVVMIAKVLPVFSQIYNELGSELSGSALLLMKVSSIINDYLIVIVVLFVIVLVGGLILYRTKYGKLLFEGTDLFMAIAASRFANCMSMTLSSGLDTERGLDLAADLVENGRMEERIAKCKDHISHGDTFSDALLKSSIFSKIYSSWIAIGTRTGSMDDVMTKICAAYEDDTDSRIGRYISVLEPVLIVILCVFIGLILISFLLPLLGIMASIG